MSKLIAIYVLTAAVFVLVVALLLHAGQPLPVLNHDPALLKKAAAYVPHSATIWNAFAEKFKEPLATLLLQLIVIIFATRTVGRLFSRFGQPAVIGEIAAGILLGPSLFGWLWPQAFAAVFPKESLNILHMFSQVGVCLFMFVIGMELDIGRLRERAQTVIAVSQFSIIVPYVLGVASALFLYPSFGNPGTSFSSFALLMGIAMAITAFPVLARILSDRGIAKTELGVTAITCAAVGDASAWAILAFVVTVARTSEFESSILTIALLIAFVLLMFAAVRPLLARWLVPEDLTLSRDIIAVVLLLVTFASLITHMIGVHALFGAFLAGTVMPREERFLGELRVRLELLTSVFLLPLFFAFSGLRTQIGLLQDLESWMICILVVGIATVGKLGGSMIPARLTGMNWGDAFSLGALMNTRGLVELIALNIGYDLGILSPRIFTIMVIMALMTTCMTCPLLNLADCLRSKVAIRINA